MKTRQLAAGGALRTALCDPRAVDAIVSDLRRRMGCDPLAPRLRKPRANADGAATAEGPPNADGQSFAHLIAKGTPMLLFLTTIGDSRVCAYIETRVGPGHAHPRVYLDHQLFSPALFDGTVLLGVMLQQPQMFLVDDCHALAGNRTYARPFAERYAMCLHVVSERLRPDDMARHAIRVKRFFPDPDSAEAAAGSVPYPTAGVASRRAGSRGSDAIVKSWAARACPSSLKRSNAQPPPSQQQPPQQQQPQRAAVVVPADAPASGPDQVERRAITVANTVLPDVYECYDDQRPSGLLLVPSIELSANLRRAFADRPCGSRVRLECVRDGNGRWTPHTGLAVPM